MFYVSSWPLLISNVYTFYVVFLFLFCLLVCFGPQTVQWHGLFYWSVSPFIYRRPPDVYGRWPSPSRPPLGGDRGGSGYFANFCFHLVFCFINCCAATLQAWAWLTPNLNIFGGLVKSKSPCHWEVLARRPHEDSTMIRAWIRCITGALAEGICSRDIAFVTKSGYLRSINTALADGGGGCHDRCCFVFFTLNVDCFQPFVFFLIVRSLFHSFLDYFLRLKVRLTVFFFERSLAVLFFIWLFFCTSYVLLRFFYGDCANSVSQKSVHRTFFSKKFCHKHTYTCIIPICKWFYYIYLENLHTYIYKAHI